MADLSRRIANLGKVILHCQRHAVAFVMRFHSFVPSFPRAWEISAMTFHRLSDSVVWQNPLRSLYFLFGHRNEGQTSKVCPSKSSDSTERITKRETEREREREREREEKEKETRGKNYDSRKSSPLPSSSTRSISSDKTLIGIVRPAVRAYRYLASNGVNSAIVRREDIFKRCLREIVHRGDRGFIRAI